MSKDQLTYEHAPVVHLQKRWSAYRFLYHSCRAISIALVVSALLYNLLHLSLLWSLLVFFTAAAAVFFTAGSFKKTASEVCRLLDATYPELEESSGLLLIPPASLGLLETLQLQKIAPLIGQLSLPREIIKKTRWAIAFVMVAALATALLVKFPLGNRSFFNGVIPAQAVTGSAAEKETLLPGITSVSLRISPPPYTHRPIRQQQQFGLAVEQGAAVRWSLLTTGNVHQVSLVFNDKVTLPLHRNSSLPATWQGEKTGLVPGFYQVNMDGKLSELYKLEIIPDQPVAIRILKPKQYSTIDFGMPPKIALTVSLSDDYGIKSAAIMATVASGEGEAVKFTEQKIAFPVSFDGKHTRYTLYRPIDLQLLKMQPGDELYYYVTATDNNNQQSRTDMYFVSIQDTAQLMSIDGLLGGVNLVPEYFRSERQIIIDTEKLIRDKSGLPVAEFNSRSNDLATDQKLLRLRYGKFLGEENEATAGGPDKDDENKVNDRSSQPPKPATKEERDHAEQTRAAEDFGNVKDLQDSYTHKHDNAEDATFFEPQQKEQLKNTLNEMWTSELKLRLYDPVAALPFEYKALRLLKDLQQQSRAYVAKTNFKTPPLKPEKRLTGDLDKIIDPLSLVQTGNDQDPFLTLRNAAPVLEELKEGASTGERGMAMLRAAAAELGTLAAEKPATYLDAAASLRNLLNRLQQGTATVQQLARVQTAFQKLFPAVRKSPANTAAWQSRGLAASYFNNLKGN